MPLGSQITAYLPFLRRYARALTGSQARGDNLVRTTLEHALDDPAAREELKQGRVALYAAFTREWLDGQSRAPVLAEGADRREAAAQAHLALIPPRSREALLLTELEEFSPEEVGQIMGISTEEAAALAAEAAGNIARDIITRVLIIEDEPLIAMQLEQIVSGLGHDITGTTTTRSQARESARTHPPGLVLADIQLADGSSGLDAVDDILSLSPDVPVIFITAYPERLLTGTRLEPTYLLTKPFREDVVRAAISQALFFAKPQA